MAAIKTIMLQQLAIGLSGSLVIGGLAYVRRSLSRSGFVAAVVLGTLLYTFSNVVWYGSLIAFFISSTILSKVKHARKRAAEQHYEKGARRDASQVAANGAVPLLAAIGYITMPHPMWWYVCLGSLAAVNADTWATELGALSRSKPRSIRNGRRVEPGTSGGVSLLGLIASWMGGCFIGLSASVLSWTFGVGTELGDVSGFTDSLHMPIADLGMALSWILIGGVSGLLASLFDSWLGASIQAVYRCPVCGRLIEKDEHCAVPSERVRGWRLMRNDQVNAAASLCGAVIAVILGISG